MEEENEIIITPLDPATFEYQEYSDSDEALLTTSVLDTSFDKNTDYIEYYIYDLNKTLLYPFTTIPLLSYDVIASDIILDPESNIKNLGFNVGNYTILYNFYRKILASDVGLKYFISNISSDRTEVELDSNIISDELMISSSLSFEQYRENAEYFVDFYLNFGQNQTVIANNIQLQENEGIEPTILIKLYEPLPDNFQVKDELWVVEEISKPQAYEVNFPFIPIVENDFTYISGPNYNLNVTQQTSKGGEIFSFNTLLQSDVTSSINQIKNLLNDKEIDINIDYESYANFVNFSSAQTRLENFVYKVGLIESSSNQLSTFLDQVTSQTINTTAYSSSRQILTNQIDSIIKNFDGYEYFLYFNSGSQYSYPKVNTEPPYILASTGSSQALEWVGSANIGTTYYGGQALSASNYDQENQDWLYWSIPEYLRNDPLNQRYELFVDMVGQYYDNVWVYTKDITNKFNADNRLDYGISKDLVADAIKDFAVKLYSSNFNTDDLFTAFLGLTPSGSTFPVVGITGSIGGVINTPTGFEYIDTKISASNDIVPLNDVQKQVYKRIYHNIPYLLKTKGTIAGIRALITSYGIPDTILRINEFGGKDRNESQDYDLKQNVFNYAFDTGTSAINYLTSSLKINSKFNTGGYNPQTIQLRFKTAGIPTASSNVASSDIRYSQSLWFANSEGGNLVLEYTGSGLISGSYSGSTTNPYDYYGTLKWIPAQSDNPDISASAYLPFFDGGWWSAQINMPLEGDSGGAINRTASLFTANQINGKIGFSASDSIVGYDSSFYNTATKANLNDDSNYVLEGTIYEPFSGSFQELRYWSGSLDEDVFFDYVVNPYSVEGNTINNTPDNLVFRADLGTQLDTASRTSIHPRITGSTIQITQSFSDSDSNYYIRPSRNLFVTNVEDIFQDQVPAGIKNRITNKMYAENLILAEAPYGFQTPTSSNATISSTTSDVISAMESIQQTSFVSQSYTPNVDYLEVGFSPSNQINDDINAQLGYFNLGDYIGDPRFISSSLNTYPNLDRLRDAYFEKYIRGYNVVDFIRLIKFFDNSLFKMIKDFTPARTSLASGVIVKQHLLERNRQRPAQATSSLHDYEGLVVNLPKNYSSGSSDFPQYSTSGSSLYKFSGGPGGSFNRFNGTPTSPSGSLGLGPNNRFFLTQSWSESADFSIINGVNFNQSNSFYISSSGGFGKFPGASRFIHNDQSEFYDGIFSGSKLIVATQSLNEACFPYLNVSDTDIVYNPIYYSFSNPLLGSVTSETFINNLNVPPSGIAWIGSALDDDGESTVKFIKLASQDVNGVEVGEYLEQGTEIIAGGAKYYILGVTNFGSHVLLNIDDNLFNANVTGSTNGGAEDYTLDNATGSYSKSGTNDLTSQGYFHQPVNAASQNIYFFGDQEGVTSANNVGINPQIDILSNFNPGDPNITTLDIINNPGANANSGGYTITKTPNTPFYFSCSIHYSASELGFSNVITSSGLYHSGNSNLGAAVATDQQFQIRANSVSGPIITGTTMSVYRPAPTSVELQNTQFVEDLTGQFFSNIIPGGSASWYDNTITSTPADGQPTELPVFVPQTDAQRAKPNLTILPGHPQFINPGTSSFDFYFPTLTFNQTSTAIPALAADITSLSGSTTYAPNEPFIFQESYANPNTNIYRTATDGTVGMSFQYIGTTLNALTGFAAGSGNPPLETPTGNFSYWEMVVQYDIEAPSGTNLSCSVYGLSQNNGSTTGNRLETFPIGVETNYEGQYFRFQAGIPESSYKRENNNWMTENTSGAGGKWQVTASIPTLDFQDFFTSTITGGQGSSNTTDWFFFKPIVKGEGGNVNYEFKNYKSSLKLIYPFGSSGGIEEWVMESVGAGFGWTKFPNTNTNSPPLRDGFQGTGTISSQTPTTNQVALVNNSGLRVGASVDICARLMRLSGSANSTSDNTPNYPQLITSSDNVTYTLTPGESTGGGGGGKGGGGGGTLTSFTETVTFTESPILNILHPYGDDYWPTSQVFIGGRKKGNGSTIINQDDTGSIYYIEYSMSNYSHPQNNYTTTFNWNNSDGANVALPANIDSGTKLIVSHSVEGNFTGTDFVTASIYITKTVPGIVSPIGQTVAQQDVLLSNDKTATGVATMSGSLNLNTYNYEMGDTFRMGVSVNKSFNYGLDIVGYSMSIYNSSSIWAPFNDASRMALGNIDLLPNNYRLPVNTPFIIQTYYGAGILPFNLALDCQPLLNNFVNQRQNSHLFDIDYNWQNSSIFFSSSLFPVNFLQILSGSAVRATVPESNYTELRSIIPRYVGSKSTSKQLNVYNIGDVGTYGKNPTIELRDAFFGYFNDLDDPYPNINNLTRVNLNYLIDEQGNALPPSLNQIGPDTFKQVFPNGTLGKLAPKLGKNQFKVLGKPATIGRIMQYVTPIMYSQNAGNNYTNVIPLSGSGYISRYDNDDESSQIFSRFNALGPASVTTTSPVQTVDFALNPAISASDEIPGNNYNPWTSSQDTSFAAGNGWGVASYPLGQYSNNFANIAVGDDLPNEQIVTVDASIVTSFVSETRRVRDELQFEFHMYTGSIGGEIVAGADFSTEHPFNLEDISCTVYTDDGRVTDIGSVLDYGWFTMVNIVNFERVRRKDFKGLSWRRNRWKWSYVPVPTGGIKCAVDWEMYETLFDLGLMRERRPRGGAGVLALEWNIKANSGEYTIKIGDQIQWRFNGFFKNARGGFRQGLFFPLGFDGQYTSINIQGVGANDYLLSEANTAQAPYWVFSGSSGRSGGETYQRIQNTNQAQRFLVMSSSNMNEAYGQSFRQADLEYFPAPSPEFPKGIEPSTTRFDNIEYPLELKIGDEIRFGNNENFTYTIERVFSPQQNNATFDRRSRLKIQLDRDVDSSINKDFFLVRRPITNPNSLYLDQPFPYDSLASASVSTIIFGPGSSGSFALTGSGTLQTGSSEDGSYTGSLSSLEIADTPGILYPDFPTEYLVQSASVIVNDLISKGIIES